MPLFGTATNKYKTNLTTSHTISYLQQTYRVTNTYQRSRDCYIQVPFVSLCLKYHSNSHADKYRMCYTACTPSRTNFITSTAILKRLLLTVCPLFHDNLHDYINHMLLLRQHYDSYLVSSCNNSLFAHWDIFLFSDVVHTQHLY